MSTSLTHRVALITGASGSIGSALARALADEGCALGLHYSRSAEPARELAEELRESGTRVEIFDGDLSDPEGSGDLIRRVRDKLGPIDVLIPAAGVADRVDSLAEVDILMWQRALAVNLTSPFLLAAGALPTMREREFGRVLFVSSVAAETGGMMGPHYAASKSGLHGMLYWLAREFASSGVTVNAIAPGLVRSGMVAGETDPSAIPLGRLGEPEEVAALAMAMLTNDFITGKVYLIDGGIRPR